MYATNLIDQTGGFPLPARNDMYQWVCSILFATGVSSRKRDKSVCINGCTSYTSFQASCPRQLTFSGCYCCFFFPASCFPPKSTQRELLQRHQYKTWGVLGGAERPQKKKQRMATGSDPPQSTGFRLHMQPSASCALSFVAESHMFRHPLLLPVL